MPVRTYQQDINAATAIAATTSSGAPSPFIPPGIENLSAAQVDLLQLFLYHERAVARRHEEEERVYNQASEQYAHLAQQYATLLARQAARQRHANVTAINALAGAATGNGGKSADATSSETKIGTEIEIETKTEAEAESESQAKAKPDQVIDSSEADGPQTPTAAAVVSDNAATGECTDAGADDDAAAATEPRDSADARTVTTTASKVSPRLQNLARVVRAIEKLSEPGTGRYALCVREFQQWIQRAERIRDARQNDGVAASGDAKSTEGTLRCTWSRLLPPSPPPTTPPPQRSQQQQEQRAFAPDQRTEDTADGSSHSRDAGRARSQPAKDSTMLGEELGVVRPFVEQLPEEWTEQVTLLRAELAALASQLAELHATLQCSDSRIATTEATVNAHSTEPSTQGPSQLHNRSHTPTIEPPATLRVIDGHCSLIAAMLEELEMLKEIQADIIDDERTWLRHETDRLIAAGGKLGATASAEPISEGHEQADRHEQAGLLASRQREGIWVQTAN
ncbi:hypothetical protein KEM52_000663 [Ascosphaera acerosa]|nr:hypothetical protein KEM52_000663 [Ascosphaera acerosa]